jgi:hypothetical protein
MTNPAPNDFSLAVAAFLGFLGRDRVANQVEWIFPEDLQLVDARFYVRVPVPDKNLARAQADYCKGIERGLGVELCVICWIGDCACSHVYVPGNEREAELHLMPAGLKMSYPTQGTLDGEPSCRGERREAIPVRNKVKWHLLRRKGARNATVKSQLFD